jgi:hypothetical protein
MFKIHANPVDLHARQQFAPVLGKKAGLPSGCGVSSGFELIDWRICRQRKEPVNLLDRKSPNSIFAKSNIPENVMNYY